MYICKLSLGQMNAHLTVFIVLIAQTALALAGGSAAIDREDPPDLTTLYQAVYIARAAEGIAGLCHFDKLAARYVPLRTYMEANLRAKLKQPGGMHEQFLADLDQMPARVAIELEMSKNPSAAVCDEERQSNLLPHIESMVKALREGEGAQPSAP